MEKETLKLDRLMQEELARHYRAIEEGNMFAATTSLFGYWGAWAVKEVLNGYERTIVELEGNGPILKTSGKLLCDEYAEFVAMSGNIVFVNFGETDCVLSNGEKLKGLGVSPLLTFSFSKDIRSSITPALEVTNVQFVKGDKLVSVRDAVWCALKSVKQEARDVVITLGYAFMEAITVAGGVAELVEKSGEEIEIVKRFPFVGRIKEHGAWVRFGLLMGGLAKEGNIKNMATTLVLI